MQLGSHIKRKICISLEWVFICLFAMRVLEIVNHMARRHNGGNGAINSALMQSKTPMQHTKATSRTLLCCSMIKSFHKYFSCWYFFVLLYFVYTTLVTPKDLRHDAISISLFIDLKLQISSLFYERWSNLVWNF